MSRSKIEWTDEVWNPLAGCSIVSTGCKNCYAMRMAHRLSAMGQAKYRGMTHEVNGNTVWTGKIILDEDALLAPLRWRRTRRVFVNSMSDLFHEDVPEEFISRVFAIMAMCPQHTFQVLTKLACCNISKRFRMMTRTWNAGRNMQRSYPAVRVQPGWLRTQAGHFQMCGSGSAPRISALPMSAFRCCFRRRRWCGF